MVFVLWFWFDMFLCCVFLFDGVYFMVSVLCFWCHGFGFMVWVWPSLRSGPGSGGDGLTMLWRLSVRGKAAKSGNMGRGAAEAVTR